MAIKTFDLITEAEARRLEPGSTVHLAAGGHVTPLAADTLRERRVVVVSDDRPPADAASLAPAYPVRRVAVGADHAGFDLKAVVTAFLRGRGLTVEDCGVHEKTVADYPDTAAAVARAVARGEADAGIAIDGAGLGSAIAANKVAGVRAAMCVTETLARYSREHNGANVLTLGASLLSTEEARAIVVRFLETPMREPRYVARLAKVAALEQPGSRTRG
jgi:ribose 5-phosphate isomerase B